MYDIEVKKTSEEHVERYVFLIDGVYFQQNGHESQTEAKAWENARAKVEQLKVDDAAKAAKQKRSNEKYFKSKK